MSFEEETEEEYLEDEDDEIEIKESDKLDDFSIVAQLSRTFDDLISPPSIEAPLIEAATRSEFTGLPDGTLTYQDNIAPIGETLDKFFVRISTEAAQAWKDWTTPVEGFTLGPKNTIEGLEEKLLGNELNYYNEIKRLKKVEDQIYQEQEDAKVIRFSSECTHFKSPHTSTQVDNNEYIKKEYIKQPFGGVLVKETKLTRVAPGAKLRIIEGISSSVVERTTYKISREESFKLYLLKQHETEVWRKPSRIEDDKYIPNAFSPDDDLDFIPPSSLSSTNFNIYPPAARPYNCTFRVFYDVDPNYIEEDGIIPDPKIKFLRSKIYKPTSKKDYTSASSIEYMIREKGYTKEILVVIDEYMANGRLHPKCKFEVDLRVTYGDTLHPDPINYKKVDPESVLGLKLLQLLNEQPYLWKEFQWDTTTTNEDNTITTEKTVAVGFTIPYPKDIFGKRVYWVYLDKEKNAIGKPSFMRKRKIPPQFSYKPYKISGVDREIPFIASVRMSTGFFYYNKENEFVSFQDVIFNIKEYMFEKGYLFVKEEQESPYVSITVLHFIHKDMSTRNQRKQVFETLQRERNDGS